MITKVLLSPPTFYDIKYEINAWMHRENKVDKEKCREEFDSLVQAYKRIGLKIEIIKPQKGVPDMVYTANCGFVIDNIFIKSNFKYPQREKESEFAEKYFKDKGFTLKYLPKDVFFEGQGDLFYRDSKFFFGYGKRSNKRSIPYLEEILGQELHTFEVNDPYYYHLDTCFGPLGEGRIVINPLSFSKPDWDKINKLFSHVIETTKKDNQLLCCNLVCQNGAIVIGKGISKDLRKTFEKMGFEVFEVPMGEYLKGGGSVKCVTLEYCKKQ